MLEISNPNEKPKYSIGFLLFKLFISQSKDLKSLKLFCCLKSKNNCNIFAVYIAIWKELTELEC